MSNVLISALPNVLSSSYTKDDLLVIVGYTGNTSGVTYHTPLTSFTQYVSAHTGTITGATFSPSNGSISFGTPIGPIVVTGLTDTYVTGGTYSLTNNGSVLFRNSSGGTFSVTGFSASFVPAGSNEQVQYNNNGVFGAATLKYRQSNNSVWNNGTNGITSNTVFGLDSMRNTTGSGNTVYGYQSYYYSGSSGQNNTAIGVQALYNNVTGSSNVAIGLKSLYTTTSSQNNLAIGSYSLYSTTTGERNIAVGYGAMSANTTGSDNLSFGPSSLQSLKTGSNNIAMGVNALKLITGSSYHIAIGGNALKSLTGTGTTGSIAIGYDALSSWNMTGPDYDNIAIGQSVASSLSSNSYANTLVGSNVFQFAISGCVSNTFFGYRAGNYAGNVSGITGNTAFGDNSLSSIQTSYNTAFGYNALTKLSTGSNNTAVGALALFNEVTGSDNVAVGGGTMQNSTGSTKNVMIGSNAGQSLTNGDSNVCVGNDSMKYATTVSGNTSVGHAGLGLLTTGLYNTAVGLVSQYSGRTGNYNSTLGVESLRKNYSGSSNVALGGYAGYSLTGGTTNGSGNTFVGFYAGYNLWDGVNNTLIGYNAQPSSNVVSNEITLGDSNVVTLRCNQTSISSLSDERDKTDIKTIPIGIDFINDLNPVTFLWNRRDGTMEGQKSAGFIAQELKEVQEKYEMDEWLNLVVTTNPDRYEATPGNLLPVIVKAIQDLSKEQKELEEILRRLENK